MPKLNVDITGRGGLGGNFYGYDDQTVASPQTDYLVEEGKLVGGFFNPYMRPGYLAPSVGTVTACTLSNSLNDVASTTIYDSENDDYYFMDKSEVQIYQGDGLDDKTLSRVKNLGSTGSPTGFDLEIYQINGVRKLFYVHEKSGNLQIGIAALPFGTENDTWLTGTVTGAFTQAITTDYCFMRVADNSYAYIFAENTVHKLDGTTAGGTNGTVTQNVLLFPTHFRVTDAIDYRGNMFMVVHQTALNITTMESNASNFSTQCGIYIWNRQSTVVSMQDYIPLTGVKAIKKIYVAPNGEVRIFTISSNGLSQIRRYNGSSFEVICELGLGAVPQYADSLATTDLITMWVGRDGSIYGHGPIKKGEVDALAKIGQLKATSTSSPETTITAGALLYGAGSSFSASSGQRTSRQGITVAYVDGGTRTINKVYPFDWGTIDNTAQNALTGSTYTPLILLPPLSKVNYVRVWHNSPKGNAGSTVEGTLTIYLNQSTTASATISITRTDIEKGYKYIPVNQGMKNGVYTIQFKMTWSTNITLSDSFTWLPRMIEIDYEPITKLL